MSQYADIIYDVERGVATITINRPQVLNAFTQDTIYEIEAAMKAAESDRSVGVVVLTGIGDRAFCVGGDIHWEKDGGLEREEYNIDKMIVESAKPYIARINGYAIGGGHHMAYFCDLSVAAEHAIFGQVGPKVGSPASGYFVNHLANIVGHKRAREMWMLCQRYTAAQALDWGLVNAVVPMAELDFKVRSYADELLAKSPTCLRLVKASFRDHMNHIMKRDMHSFVRENAPNYFASGEANEGHSAFLEKRQPDFGRWR